MFLDDNFLLDTETGRRLYSEYAISPPIFDYHCHLPPAEIAENKQYDSITELWLGGDHYKWRALRANGVAEDLITGHAGPLEKFQAWAQTVPKAIGNPLYQWAHLELKRYFGIDDILSPSTARSIFDRCNEQIASDNFRPRKLMERMNVRVVCTTDDPVDDLSHHSSIANDSTFNIGVLPAFRPDKVFAISNTSTWNNYVDLLAEASNLDISSLDTLIEALKNRIDYFHDHGCRISDHGIEAAFSIGSHAKAAATFQKARAGSSPSAIEADEYAGAVMTALGRTYAERQWIMQIHLGALRNNSRRAFALLGPDSGYDAIGDSSIGRSLVSFLDELDSSGKLPKTIIYNVNPRDNEMIASIAGSFQGDSVPGKVQFGSAWWYNDQRDGMERQLTALSNVGLLSRFVGMITDSRSFLSYPRHEYFRRVLCRLLGRWIEDGEIPDDNELLSELIEDVCFGNAADYFGLTSA